jgi:hypothetical protein
MPAFISQRFHGHYRFPDPIPDPDAIPEDMAVPNDEEMSPYAYNPLPIPPLFCPVKQEAEEASGDTLRVDLDEGAHAAYVISKSLTNGFSDIGPQLKAEANLYGHTPKEWMRHEAVHVGDAADTGVFFGSSVLMFPLAFLAIEAGVEETTEAIEKSWKLVSERKKIEANIQSIKAATHPGEDPPRIFLHAQKIEKQSLAAVNNALQHNFYDGGIGCNSFLSGCAIAIKVAADTALRIVAMVVVQGAAGLSTAATVLAAVGMFFFAPLAAAASVGLASFFVHQGRMVVKELKADREKIETVASREMVAPDPIEQTYKTFIARKLTSRENFATRFLRWNSGFLSGACFYALSVGIKAVLGVAAFAGFAAFLATPVGFAVILTAGIIGGIVMTVCSWQFLMSHGKSKTHQAYRLQESPFLGRRFDAIHTMHTLNGPNAANAGTASSLRAGLYRFASRRDAIRQDGLHRIARAAGKFREWEHRATDEPSPQGLITKPRQRYKNVLAYFSYFHAYIGTLFSGASHKAAVQKAQEVYAARADSLTTVAIARWLGGNDEAGGLSQEREQAQRTLLTDMLREQKIFLAQKLAAYDAFRNEFFDSPDLSPEVQDTFEKAQKEARSDDYREAKITYTLGAVLSLNQLKLAFLHQQGLDPNALPTEDEADKINRLLAEFLKKGLTKELTATRGILFDMERSAANEAAAAAQ